MTDGDDTDRAEHCLTTTGTPCGQQSRGGDDALGEDEDGVDAERGEPGEFGERRDLDSDEGL